MKRILILLLAFSLLFCVTACGGDDKTTTTTEKNDDGGGGQQGGSLAIADINAENWAEVIRENFGLELSLPEGWSVKSAESPNGANNVKLFFNVGGSTTYADFGELLFSELQKDAFGDIHKYGNSSLIYTSFAEAAGTMGIASFSASLDERGYKEIVINYYNNGSNVELLIQRHGF